MPLPPMPAEWKKYKTGARSGFRRLTVKGALLAKVVKQARQFLSSLQMGQSKVLVIDDKEFMFVAEPHYHEPPKKPVGWHKGVSAYEKA